MRLEIKLSESIRRILKHSSMQTVDPLISHGQILVRSRSYDEGMSQ